MTSASLVIIILNYMTAIIILDTTAIIATMTITLSLQTISSLLEEPDMLEQTSVQGYEDEDEDDEFEDEEVEDEKVEKKVEEQKEEQDKNEELDQDQNLKKEEVDKDQYFLREEEEEIAHRLDDLGNNTWLIYVACNGKWK